MPLETKAHKLKPIVIVGNKGLTENVINEIHRGLLDHELIKIRIQTSDREEKQKIFTEICGSTEADPVQFIGGIGVIYKKREM